MKSLSPLFCLLIFLFLLVTEARNNPQKCSSSCGDIPIISYPFRLKEDPASCGHPDFKLSCQNNTTILNFHGGLYYVKRISYEEHIIRVVDVNFANGSCGLPNRALSMDQVMDDSRYPGHVNYSWLHTLNYVRCSSNFSNLGNSRVPCLSGNSSNDNVYVNLTQWGRLRSFEIPTTCQVISTLPATFENLDVLQQQNPSYETILKMQESGFDMIWSVECADCTSNDHQCVWKFNSTTMFECKEIYDEAAEIPWIYAYFIGMFVGATSQNENTTICSVFSPNLSQARKNPKICSSSCGDIANISYPFRLKEDPSNCGDPDYELSCHNNNTTTILNFHGGLYKVKKISYDKHTIRVVDVNLANGSCNLPYKALVMADVPYDTRYRGGQVDYHSYYHLYFVRCSNNISNLANLIAVPCLSGNSSHVYVNISWPYESTLTSSDFPNSCKIISFVPAKYENLYQNLNFSYETILKMQESGFDMTWSVECRDCAAKGLGCTSESEDTHLICQSKEEYDDGLRETYRLLATIFLLESRKKNDAMENSANVDLPLTPEPEEMLTPVSMERSS
ncbi:hypothetical protein CCACVL1_23870 [Corchorus capsularis]|uniref:non-specific serine/threonine protein kinase n=1 Tax=Corchorus capsularis TaxID=210143 RepID=A0A1R3GRU9_COCAP|nr:hypothetical protein CCACVL1_23870 [Corchorus capsularis]